MIFLTLWCALILLSTVLTDSSPHDHKSNPIWEASTSYADLLKKLVNINENRFQALSQYVHSLSNETYWTFRWTGSVLRTGKEASSALKDGRKKTLLLVFLTKRTDTAHPNKFHSFKSSPMIEENDSNNDSSDEDDDESSSKWSDEVTTSEVIDEEFDWISALVSRKWMGSCSKKAYKVCYKACKEAFKDACSTHDCKRGIKKYYPKQCKSSCKARFKVNKRGSDTE